MPKELLDIAERVRGENEGLPEYIVRRRVRDQLDKARLRLGPVSMGGLDDVERAYSGMTGTTARRPATI